MDSMQKVSIMQLQKLFEENILTLLTGLHLSEVEELHKALLNSAKTFLSNHEEKKLNVLSDISLNSKINFKINMDINPFGSYITNVPFKTKDKQRWTRNNLWWCCFQGIEDYNDLKKK